MAAMSWKTRAEADLGVTLTHWQALSGGDFAQSYVATVESSSGAASQARSSSLLQQSEDVLQDVASAELEPGTQLFIKTHADPPPRHFSTEALGLHWLAQTDTVNVPTVLGVSDEVPYLAISWVEESRKRHGTDTGESAFGRQLAALHQYACPAFGREDQRSTGSLGLPNAPTDTWAEFYATQRLLPLARIAADRGALDASILTAIDTLAGRLAQLFPEPDRPSRLHGDLWAGNRLVDTEGNSWVIDPASHGGHREFDLAMMRLFGGYSEACFDAYHEACALEPDWQERIALHQLAPLIVHAIKFGSAYVGPTRDALKQYV